MATEIQQLSDLISSSVSALLKACHENDTPFPDGNQPFTSQSEAFRANKVAHDATNVIAAAALQLAGRVLTPQTSLMNIMSGHLKNAALHTALNLNVTEILREAGPQGLHADEIAKICDVDSNKLGKEVTPGVFANTRISSVMDTGKYVAELLERPNDKHEGTPGFVALLEAFTGDGAKYSSQLFENIKDPKTAYSSEPTHSPFNRACGVDVPIWAWYETPEQSYRRRRFAIGMYGLAQMQPPDLLDDGPYPARFIAPSWWSDISSVLDWKALSEGSVVVDVGGGIGTSAIAVARKNEHLKFVVQDLQNICTEARAPVANASVFILKHILHDWSDPYCSKILKALRAAATPDTKLVVVDNIVAYACHDPANESGLNTGYKEAPAPLLPNYGAANVIPYVYDGLVRVVDVSALLCYVTNKERADDDMAQLTRKDDWES
ncbi:hypothetical protein C0991_001139 [Blastosporella zonata]|nr:hypothetical protein C0991_001139 [Blastosporella zonata]